MQLTLAYRPVNSIGFGERLSLDGTALTVSQDELRAIVLEDPLIDAVDFAVAAPNDSLRAGPVFDIVEPRAKAPGGSPDWPGILGAPHTLAQRRIETRFHQPIEAAAARVIGAPVRVEAVVASTWLAANPGPRNLFTGILEEQTGA